MNEGKGKTKGGQCKECERGKKIYREHLQTLIQFRHILIPTKVRKETSIILFIFLLFVHHYFYFYIYIKGSVPNLILIYI